MKKIITYSIIVVIFFGGMVWWSQSLQSEDPNVISARGIHWHPELAIYVNGEQQEIPANIGVGPQYASTPTYSPSMRMSAMHTHDPDGTIHLEFGDMVTRDDIKLGNLFKIWGKGFMEFGSSVTMTVNGIENSELEDYEMKDGDKIELRYE